MPSSASPAPPNGVARASRRSRRRKSSTRSASASTAPTARTPLRPSRRTCMLVSLKRRRILRGREEAVAERHQAARDFVAAIREAEGAMEAIKAANDKLYRSDLVAEQSFLSELRSGRERTFTFHLAKEVEAEAQIGRAHVCTPVTNAP